MARRINAYFRENKTRAQSGRSAPNSENNPTHSRAFQNSPRHSISRRRAIVRDLDPLLPRPAGRRCHHRRRSWQSCSLLNTLPPSLAAASPRLPQPIRQCYSRYESGGGSHLRRGSERPCAPANPPPFPPAAEAPVPPSPPSPRWSEVGEERVLEILRAHLRRHDDLPRGVDLLMAVFDRPTRTDYSLAEVEDLVTGLRQQFEENDALLYSGRYTLSLEVWGAAPTAVAPPKPAAPTPIAEVPAKNAAGANNPVRPAGRPRQTAALPAKKMRYEEMRVKYPRLPAKVDEMTRKALEGVSDMTAWSLELRMKNQQLAGDTPAARTDDRAKELTSLISTVI